METKLISIYCSQNINYNIPSKGDVGLVKITNYFWCKARLNWCSCKYRMCQKIMWGVTVLRFLKCEIHFNFLNDQCWFHLLLNFFFKCDSHQHEMGFSIFNNKLCRTVSLQCSVPSCNTFNHKINHGL